MLNINIKKDDLLLGMQIAEKAAPPNKIRPILSGLYLESKKGKIFLRATNLEMTIDVDLTGEVIEEGKVVFPYQQLAEFLKIINVQDITIQEFEGKMALTTSESLTEVAIFDSEEYPVINKLEEGTEYYINKTTFLNSLEKTKIAASVSHEEENLPVRCVRVEILEQELKTISTDSFRMVYKSNQLESEFTSKESIKVSLPLDTVEVLIKTLKLIDGKILNIKQNADQILFTIGEVSIFSKIVNLPFPNYSNILKKDKHNKKVLIKSRDFLMLLKSIMIFVRDNKEAPNGALFNFNGNTLTIKGISDIAKINEKIEILKEGDDIKISLNVRFLLDFVQEINEKNVEIQMFDGDTSIIIRGENNSDYIYMTMPLAFKDI